MYIFLDTISETHQVLIYTPDRKIHAQRSWIGAHQEFELLNKHIFDLLTENQLQIHDIQGLTLCIGPGGFTGTRITSLVANSLLHFADIPLQGITYFELLQLE